MIVLSVLFVRLYFGGTTTATGPGTNNQETSNLIEMTGEPDYLEVDHAKMTATFQRIPALADVPFPVIMEPNLVVEFYSR